MVRGPHVAQWQYKALVRGPHVDLTKYGFGPAARTADNIQDGKESSPIRCLFSRVEIGLIAQCVGQTNT